MRVFSGLLSHKFEYIFFYAMIRCVTDYSTSVALAFCTLRELSKSFIYSHMELPVLVWMAANSQSPRLSVLLFSIMIGLPDVRGDGGVCHHFLHELADPQESRSDVRTML
jgi:hypothetical protein